MHKAGAWKVHKRVQYAKQFQAAYAKIVTESVIFTSWLRACWSIQQLLWQAAPQAPLLSAGPAKQLLQQRVPLL